MGRLKSFGSLIPLIVKSKEFSTPTKTFEKLTVVHLFITGQSIQKENTRPRNQQHDDHGKKGNHNDANNKNAGNKRQNRRPRRRSYNSATRNKGEDFKQRNGGANVAANMVAAAN